MTQTSEGWQSKNGNLKRRTPIDGKTPREAGQLLSQTRPDAAAVPYMDMDAIDRYQAVAAAREASPTPR